MSVNLLVVAEVIVNVVEEVIDEIVDFVSSKCSNSRGIIIDISNISRYAKYRISSSSN